ncbi:MAG: LacI family DNA-binding transcriptional regulator, partial [Pseudomonadota bacterium]
LLAQGYKKVAHLSGPPSISTAIGRRKGYLRALRQPPPSGYIVDASYHEESSGFEAMQKLLRLAKRPDAVFAASDPIAIGALQAIQQAGLDAGPDVGVIGVGNHRYGEYLRTPLSTVDQRRNEIGRTAARLLLRKIRGDSCDETNPVIIEPELIVRASSRRAGRS